MGNSKRASTQIRPFDADDITTASTRPFDDDGYDPRLLSQRFNESYFAAADDEEHYIAVADPPYHGDGLPPLTILEESPPPSKTSAPPGFVTLPACRSLTAGVVLDTSFVPPLIYAFMGSSKDIAIGPSRRGVSLAWKFGFFIDFLSHAAIVGFMAGAAITIALQQLKSLLGVKNFTKKTDIVSVMRSVWSSVHHGWNWQTIGIGLSFMAFLLFTKYTDLSLGVYILCKNPPTSDKAKDCYIGKDPKLLLANPGPVVIEKLQTSNFATAIGQDKIFLTVEDAVLTCAPKMEEP
ncbi:hypothetical protein F0562_020371 [Nyssa sinensis]|uniref:SLC26A/SulP transporter domain-containing protein n=1 Tax=Nyssa sinensis TaxID=561372 RepID=A0A5J5BUY9_9ASTE|nr:hypothetical protein F0562_020371 [Nyssa sinensis]